MTASRGLVLMVLRQGRAISTYPTVVNAARMWKRAGWEVDILTQAAPDVPDLFRRFERFSSRRFPLQMLQVLRQTQQTRPDAVIAYEPIDAELCAFLPGVHKARYIYHNIELRYPGQRCYRLHQTLERLFYIHCETVVSQDPLRLGELKKLLGKLPASAMEYCIPNTYMKEALPEERQYWHKRFNLAEGQKIMLYTGAIEQKKIPREIVSKILEAMPSHWSLALWGWSVKGYVESLAEFHCEKIRLGRLLLSPEALPERQYLDAVISANAGLVWYGTTIEEDRNEYNIGLSSGKFWRFVSAGIPVLASNHPGMGDYIQRNNLGTVIDSVNQINTQLFDSFTPLTNNPDHFYEYHYRSVINPVDGS